MSVLIIAALALLEGGAGNPGTRPPEPVPMIAPAGSEQGIPAPAIPVAVAELPPHVADIDAPFKEAPVAPESGHEGDQADIVVTVRGRSAPGDPIEAVNFKAFAATQAIDRALVGPAALAYQHTVPAPVRSGVRNVLNNLHEPDVFLNYLLQLKPGKAAETFARFAVNSTLGVGGLFDIAKRRPFKLPRRHNGFADTFGYYGVKPGPFLYLPLIGPTTVRDLIGGGLDRFVLPLAVGRPFNRLTFTIPVGVVSALDHRAEFDEQLHILHDGAADPYAASRDFYLRRRQAEIDGLHGKRHGAAKPESAPAAVSAEPTAPAQKSPAPD